MDRETLRKLAMLNQLALTEEQKESVMDFFAKLGKMRPCQPDSAQAQAWANELQAFLTEHYYTCTKQILQGLGMMYVAGDSMTDNIDAAGGEGTAEFAHKAIEVYCK